MGPHTAPLYHVPPLLWSTTTRREGGTGEGKGQVNKGVVGECKERGATINRGDAMIVVMMMKRRRRRRRRVLDVITRNYNHKRVIVIAQFETREVERNEGCVDGQGVVGGGSSGHDSCAKR